MNKCSVVCFILFLFTAMTLVAPSDEEKLYRLIHKEEYKKAENFCKKQTGPFQQKCYRILAGARFGPQIENWVLHGEEDKIEKLCFRLRGRMQQECMRITGDAYLENQKPGKAALYYEKAKYPEGNNRIAAMYLRNGDYENALRYFEKGITSSIRARGYGKVAAHYKDRGEIGRAGLYYTAAIKEYETLLKNIEYEWNQPDCMDRLRLIKEKESLLKLPREKNEQTHLEQILGKCAEYCTKLEQSVFHFYCREEVYERLYYIDGFPQSNYKQEETLRRFDYEYQVIRDKKGINENRKPLRIDKIPFRHIQAGEKPIAFSHRYLIYGPIILLGEKRQPFYKYGILEEETTDGEKMVVIEALPLYIKDPPLQFGKARVKVSDGSVVGIEWNPKSIRNFQSLLDQTARLGIFPKISFSIELDVVKNNLHFPGNCHVKWTTEDIGKKLISGARKKGYALTGVATDIIYKDYKFFSIGTEVVEVKID